jgi:hypothetical protein
MMNIEKNILNNWLLYHAEIGVEMVVAHNHKNDRVLSCMEAQKIFIDNEYSRINVLILDENHIVFEILPIDEFYMNGDTIILKAL